MVQVRKKEDISLFMG